MIQIRCPLYEASIISKHEPSIVSDERTLTYFDFHDMVSQGVVYLRRSGVKPGDRVGLYLAQDWRYPVLFFALIRLGAVACPISTRLPPAAAVDQLHQLKARHVIARIDPSRKTVLGDIAVIDPMLASEPVLDSEPLVWDQKVDLDAPAAILFTSGSSGTPKPAVLTYGNFYYSARGANVNMKIASRDRWLLSLPLYHVGGIGILFRCILAGARIAIPQAGESIAEARKRMEITHLSLVPAQLLRLLRDDPTPRFNEIKAVLLGGSACPRGLLKEAMDRKLRIFPSYGMTEMTSQITTMAPISPPTKRHTSGLPLKYREVRIAADGEIHVRGRTLFAGYLEGDETKLPLTEDGWFATGDLGRIDAEGYLDLIGRKDNLFISGGENIQPEEIEKLLSVMPEIDEAIVVPVPNEEFGQRPFAFVRFRTQLVEPQELVRRLESVLPKFKIPVRFEELRGEDGELKRSRAELRAIAEVLYRETPA